MLLVDRGTWPAWAIQGGQWLLAHLPVVGAKYLQGFTWLNHVAIIREDTPGVFTVSEMGMHGHQIRDLEHYLDHTYCVVDFEVPNRELVLAADTRFHGIDYGFIQYPFLIINGLTGAKIAASYGSSMICSTHVTMICENVYFSPDRQAAAVIPAHIAYWVDARRPALG